MRDVPRSGRKELAMSDENVNAAATDDTQVTPVPEENTAPDAPEKIEDAVEEVTTEAEDVVAETPTTVDSEAEQAEPEHKPSRKERREERRQNYLESIRRDSIQRPTQQVEEYNPLDLDNPEQYSKEDGYVDPAKLREDREKYAKQVAERQREEDLQDHYVREIQLEAKSLERDPDFSIINPDSDDFDEDFRSDMNERFLAHVGFYVDPQTGKGRFRNTDVSFEKWARADMERLRRFAGLQTEKTTKNIVAAKSKQAVRPGASTQRGPNITTPEALAKMDPEEFAKHEKEILAYAAKLPPR